jgi:hypothetical protein
MENLEPVKEAVCLIEEVEGVNEGYFHFSTFEVAKAWKQVQDDDVSSNQCAWEHRVRKMFGSLLQHFDGVGLKVKQI